MAEMTLEEAFAAATVDVPAGVVDDVFVIDAPNRKIIVPDSETTFGVETDKDVERKYFRCPRIVGDNIDLYAHKIYVVYVFSKDVRGTFQPEIVNGTYWCDDVAVDGDCITFSWKLSDNVMDRSGIIAFKILAATTENGFEKTRWNTVPAYGTVQMTVPDGDDIAERYPDIVTQLLERMDAVEAIATEEAMKGFVAEYMKNHPVQLDETLTDSTKAAPANLVGDLKQQVADLLYEEITITSFSCDKSPAELGSTVNDVTLTWKINKTPTTLTLDGESIDASSKSKSLSGLGLTANKTWKLKATDEKNHSYQRDTTLSFVNGIYYGVAAESTYDSAFVLALTKVLSGSKARTITVNAGEGQYIYYCLPSRLGTPAFNVGGFDGGFKKVAAISFTNASGYSEDYDIWKSDNANLGNTTVKVS